MAAGALTTMNLLYILCIHSELTDKSGQLWPNG